MTNEYDKKRVLVTGGAGFLGSHLCDRLLKDGDYVICLDNFYTSHQANIEHLSSNKYFEVIEHDVINPIKIDVDEIYNFACPASPIHYQRDPIYTLKTCVLGAINTSELAIKTDAKLLHASTSEVYGDPEVHPQTEDYWGRVNPIGYRSCYDEGKRCAETIFFDYHRKNNLKLRLARIFNTYGPRLRSNDGRVIPTFILQALNNDPITVYGNGEQTRSFCYVDDLIEGFIQLMSSNEIIGPVNLGNPEEYSVKDLSKIIIDFTKSNSEIEFLPLPSDDPTQRKPDIQLAKSKLNWEPKVPLNDGLIKTISYFQNNKLKSRQSKIITTNIKSPSYVTNNNSKINILVTGVAGFIGSHVSKRLHEEGFNVLGIDQSEKNYSAFHKLRLENLIKETNIDYLETDIANYNHLYKAFESFKPNKVIHLAATAGVRGAEEKFSNYIQSNLIGHANTLDIAAKFNIEHFLYASSSSVYGNTIDQPFTESYRTDDPVSFYAATKKSNELMSEAYSINYSMKTTGMRFFTVYGPWGRPDMAYFKFAKNIIDNKAITVYSNGELKRDFTYIDDVVESILRLININLDGEGFHKIFNVGSGKPISVMELIKTIELILGKKALISFEPMQMGDVILTSANNQKLKEAIDFEPATTLKDGLGVFCSWLRDNMKKSENIV